MKYHNLLQKEIYDEYFNKSCLNPEVPINDRTDCAANSLYFLDILDEFTGMEYSNVANEEKKGLTIDKLATIVFSKTQRNYRTGSFMVPRDENSAKTVDNILNFYYLANKFGTIGLFFNANKPKILGHAVALVRDPKGILAIVDLQQGKLYIGLDEIQKFVTEQKYDTLSLLFATEKRPISLNKIRKTKNSEPQPKRRKTIKITMKTVKTIRSVKTVGDKKRKRESITVRKNKINEPKTKKVRLN